MLRMLAVICCLLVDSAAHAQVFRPIRPVPGGTYPVVAKKPLEEFVADLKVKDKRLHAVLGLAEHYGKDAGPAAESLAALLLENDEDLRLNAALCLGKIGKPALVPIADLLVAKDDDVRFYALWTLGWIGPDAKEAAPRVIEAMGDKNDGVRRKAIYALSKIAPGAKEAQIVLLKALEDNNVAVVTAAGDAVVAYGAEAVPSLMKLLDANKPAETRTIAIKTLGAIGPAAKDAAPLLAKTLLDKTIHRQVPPALAKIGKDAIPHVLDVLKNQDLLVESVCIDTLRQIAPEAAPHLVDLLGDNRPAVRVQAARALGAMRVSDKSIVIGLAYALKDADSAVRVAALSALQTFGAAAKPAVPQLLGLLGDPDANTRRVTFFTLRNLGEDLAPHLKKILDGKDENLRVATATLMVQNNLDRELAIPVLVATLKGKDEVLRLQSANTLAVAKLEAATVVPILKDTLSHDKEAARLQAIQSLRFYGAQARDALPKLTELSTNDPSPTVRQRAKFAVTILSKAK